MRCLCLDTARFVRSCRRFSFIQAFDSRCGESTLAWATVPTDDKGQSARICLRAAGMVVLTWMCIGSDDHAAKTHCVAHRDRTSIAHIQTLLAVYFALRRILKTAYHLCRELSTYVSSKNGQFQSCARDGDQVPSYQVRNAFGPPALHLSILC